MKSAIVGIAFAIWSGSSIAADMSVYTPTNGYTCIDRSREYYSAWTCPGPGGYSAEFFDEGNLVAFTIRASGKGSASRSYSWRGSGKVFGDLVEWRLTGHRPEAAVLRIWRTENDEDGKEREVQELAVFKISRTESCRFGSIDARTPGANDLARRLAVKTSTDECSSEE